MTKERVENKDPVVVKKTVDRNDTLYRNLEIAKHRISASPNARGFHTGVPAALLYRNSTNSLMLFWMKAFHSAGLSGLAEFGYSQSTVGINGYSALVTGVGLSEETFQILLTGEEMWALSVNCDLHWRVISLNNLL